MEIALLVLLFRETAAFGVEIAEVRVNRGFWAMLPGAFSLPETLEDRHLE